MWHPAAHVGFGSIFDQFRSSVPSRLFPTITDMERTSPDVGDVPILL
jgi:hypothetical protein